MERRIAAAASFTDRRRDSTKCRKVAALVASTARRTKRDHRPTRRNAAFFASFLQRRRRRRASDRDRARYHDAMTITMIFVCVIALVLGAIGGWLAGSAKKIAEAEGARVEREAMRAER